MGIRRKDFYELSATPKLLSDEFTSTIPHETDGLIFQPVAGVRSFKHCLSAMLSSFWLLALHTWTLWQTVKVEAAGSVDNRFQIVHRQRNRVRNDSANCWISVCYWTWSSVCKDEGQTFWPAVWQQDCWVQVWLWSGCFWYSLSLQGF